MKDRISANVIIVPGLGSSGPQHWQTLWGTKRPDFSRVEQLDWETPACADWVAALDKAVLQYPPASVVLVAHSLACIAVAFWAQQHHRRIRAALLVAPADTEAADFPEGTTGFSPILLEPLPFKSMVVASTTDPYITEARARQLATTWGSEFVSIGAAGHINSGSGHGEWETGWKLLEKLVQSS
ncbi:RBBP9/YdeN family alpha/beta hydrolase [Pontibacter sp. CAU 1760]